MADLRPQFHFTAPKGWLNDPNGLVCFKGEWHLFYQHNPHGTEWGDMTWGHAASRDLVRWTHLPNALEPDEHGTVYSGSAVVAGSELRAYYTAAGNPFTQRIAVSRDRGRTFQKLPKAVLENLGADERDPKVFRFGKTWVMALWVPRGPEKTDGIEFYVSEDGLTGWSYASRIEGFFECPDCFELPVFREGERRWVLFGADGDYMLGSFDGRTFHAEGGPKRKSVWGGSYYAAQTYSDVPKSDGRRVLIGWMRGGSYPGQTFSQQMTFPVALSLRRFPGGDLRLCRTPVREVESLRAETHVWKNQIVRTGENPLAGLSGELWDIELTASPAPGASVTLAVAGEPLTWKDGALSLAEASAPVPLRKGRLTLRVLADRTSLEVFADGGSVSFSRCVLPKPGSAPLALAVTSDFRLDVLNVHALRSAVSP